jgi:hypothetical protein
MPRVGLSISSRSVRSSTRREQGRARTFPIGQTVAARALFRLPTSSRAGSTKRMVIPSPRCSGIVIRAMVITRRWSGRPQPRLVAGQPARAIQSIWSAATALQAIYRVRARIRGAGLLETATTSYR